VIGNNPTYRELYERGELERRVERGYQILKECELCPRECRINREKGERGFCEAGIELTVSSFHAHFGEEPPISGYRGSGTIFLTYCNLRCVFCQNYPISHLGNGNQVSSRVFSQMMLNLQKKGCHNINLVTPTDFVPQILAGLLLAIQKGLNIPLVYNCSGYEKVETLKLLEGIIDIYMPDIKYGGREEGKKYSSAPDYFQVVRKAIREMHRQVGNLSLDEEGIAKRGLLVRHLVLPNKLARTKRVFSFLAKEISPATYISIMSQYFPAYRAEGFEELNRRITDEEYEEALDIARELGLKRGWRQN
jgi:putative pyruvate formate lyase activating enzyme